MGFLPVGFSFLWSVKGLNLSEDFQTKLRGSFLRDPRILWHRYHKFISI